MTTSRMPETREPNPGARRPRPSYGGRRCSPTSKTFAGFAAAGALAIVLTACSSSGAPSATESVEPTASAGAPTESGAPSDSSAFGSVPGFQAPGTESAVGRSGNGGALRLTATVDGTHGWITVAAELAGMAAKGECVFVVEENAAGGAQVGAQTRRILETKETSRCAGASFAVDAGEYRVTVTAPDASNRPLSVSTVVEFPAAG